MTGQHHRANMWNVILLFKDCRYFINGFLRNPFRISINYIRYCGSADPSHICNILKTKRVSQETIDKITAILKEQNYVPHMGSVMLSGHGSRIIGVVVGFNQAHGMQPLQDSFVGELVGTIQNEAEAKGYYIMLIGGENIQHVVDIASRWNVEGLIILEP